MRGPVGLVLAAAAIGAGTIATKAAYRAGVSPDSVLVWRFAVGSLLVVAWRIPGWWRGGRAWRLDLGAVICVVSAGVVLWCCWRAELEGLAHLDAGILVVLAAMAPVWIVAIAAVRWRVRPAPRELIAIAVLVAGVAVMVNPQGSSFAARGVVAGLLTGLAAAVLILMLERIRRVSAATLLDGALIVGGFLSLIAYPGALEGPLAGTGALLSCAIVGACAALWTTLVAIGIRHSTAIGAAITFSLEPVLVAGAAYVLLGEALSARQILGGSMVIGAVALVANAGPGGASGEQPGGNVARYGPTDEQV